jgi:hypothetical protein
MDKWPAAFFARGLYDYAASLQGTVDSYSRVKGLKELVVVRGPHPFESWPNEEQRRVQERAIAFAQAVIQGRSRVDGARPWTTMKDLVATCLRRLGAVDEAHGPALARCAASSSRAWFACRYPRPQASP